MLNRPSKAVMARVVVVVGALVAALMLPFISHDVGYAQTNTHTYAENGTGEVASYSATDPEGKTVFWKVTGDDAGKFNVDDGTLTFKTPPDFENPTDSDKDNIYEVTVEANDGGADTIDEISLTVKVTNVEEDGTATLSLLQPMVGTTLTATVADPDKITKDTVATWQWASSPDGTTWTDIADATGETYKPVLGDAGNLLRATASYTDGAANQGDAKDTSLTVSANATRTRPDHNSAPEFPDQNPDKANDQSDAATRNIDEDIAAGQNVGNPVSANDTDNDILTYSLGDAAGKKDAESFDIDRATGQISVAAGVKFDFETAPNEYTVTVTATDPQGDDASDLITVTINVGNVNEPPSNPKGDKGPGHDFFELAMDKKVATYTATDDSTDAGDLTWSVSGVDADSFDITTKGALSFKDDPDFENPGDSGGDNVYEVTVVASDVGNKSGSLNETVKVENTDEDGAVTLSNRQPEVGVRLTASLTDPDGGVSGVTWVWAVGGTNVPGETSSTFEPGEFINKAKVKVTASYTDNEDSGKTMSAESHFELQRRSSTNTAPVFVDAVKGTARSVDEMTKAPSPVGNPVAASDADIVAALPADQKLTYTLGGTDAALFDIDEATGQINVGEGTDLDYETKTTYNVVVTATDGSGATATIAVTINVDGVNEVPTVTGLDKADYAENGTGPVATYTGSDPEGKPIIWTLAGVDAEDFSITGGALSFTNPPDFEKPKGGKISANNPGTTTYVVTVEAGDGGQDKGEKVVTVTVTNVEEDGAVTLRLLQPQVGASQTADLADSDGDISGESWQWAGSSDGETGWADIVGAKSYTYTPKSPDVGNFLRATVSYTDGNGDAMDTVAAVSAYATRARPSSNDAPEYDPVATAISVAENVAAGQNVGEPVTATDDDGDVLTYELGDVASKTDAGSFELDKATAQITVAAGTSLDFETTPSYQVTVTAIDPAGTAEASHSSTVTITVTNVDEAPSIAAGATTAFTSLESKGVGKDNQFAKYTATDPESGATTWSLAGADADKFVIPEGALGFKAMPDFENPGDSDTDNVYEVTVVVSDAAGNQDALSVTVGVTNADEDGKVSLSTLQPEADIGVTATVSDLDIVKRDEPITWQWATVKDVQGTDPEDIDGATSATYVPTSDQVGKFLKATASYTDGTGTDDASDVSANKVVKADSTNKTPKFPDTEPDVTGHQTGPIARSVFENEPAGEPVGDPVKANDDDNDVLTYSFGGADAGFFDFVRATGQITVGDGTKLDYEARINYTVTMTATDPSNASVTATVNITVTDVNEAPVITPQLTDLEIKGSSRIDYAENGTDAAATYTAAGPQSAGAVWTISGADAGDFAIGSATGELGFGASPDFETPTDADADNVYNVTVEAASGDYSDTFDVVVTVTNEDEDGVVTLSAQQPVIGTELTAAVTDVDGLTAGTVTWQWSAGTTADGIAENIAGADAAAYTPVTADKDKFLSVKASYDDSEGAGKSAVAVASSAVSDVVGPMSYDANGNGTIEKSEVITAIRDYFADRTTKQLVLDLIRLYFSS